MLLRRLKSNNAFNLIFIPLAVVALWMKSFLQPFIYEYSSCENTDLLFSPIAKLLGTNALLHVITGAVLCIALAFLMQLINSRYAFIRIRSKLPGVLFVIVISGFTALQTLHPVYLGALFMLLAIYRLFGVFEKSKPYSAVFDVGFLLGVSVLICLKLIVFFPAFVTGMVVLSRDTRWREFVLILLGFVLPFLFGASYAFLSDSLSVLVDNFIVGITKEISHFNQPALRIYLGVLLFYTFIASIDVLKQYDKKKISSRKYFTAFFWIFIAALISYIFVPAVSQEILVVAMIPLTFLFSNFFVFMKRRFWGEFLFVLLILVVVVMQFFDAFLHA